MGDLADTVRDARRRRGWSQAQLAERAGVTLGVVSTLERRLSKPQAANARSILMALGLAVDDDPKELDEETRRWPADVSVFTDVMGLFLSNLPEEERGEIMRTLTRNARELVVRSQQRQRLAGGDEG